MEREYIMVTTIVENELAQLETRAAGERVINRQMSKLIRDLGTEGIVLLKNDESVLPITNQDVVSVFGRCQLDWFYVGYGSGGDVHPPYKISLMDGLRSAYVKINDELASNYIQWCQMPENIVDHGTWGNWPFFHEEMPLTDNVVKDAANNSTVALIVIGRAAGEDRENALEPGSFYLTETEKMNLQMICKHFSKIVLIMNCGNIIDMSFINNLNISSILYVWQLGQESGNAVADVLTGKINPSGKLADTIAYGYEDYPSATNFGNREFNNYTEDIFVGYRFFESFKKKVLFPFGYGLSYTSFSMKAVSITRNNSSYIVDVKITNTGDRAGKEVAQIYCVPPTGSLSKARKNLVAFGKTNIINPARSETIRMIVNDIDCSSFDDCGVTGYKNAFVMEPGTYHLLLGNSSATENSIFSFPIDVTKLIEQCHEACAPVQEFPVLTLQGNRNVTLASNDLRKRILDNLPHEIPCSGDKGYVLNDVVSGAITLDDFVAQLTDEELGDLSRGEGMMRSSLGPSGNAGVFGGITESLRVRGIPPLSTSDGPAGIRVNGYSTLLPCGTAIACSWNEQLTEQVFELIGQEGCRIGIDVLLSPGMKPID